MKKTFYGCTIILLLCACFAFFTTCSKEYSNEGGPKKYTAVYTLVGAGGNCSGSVLSGNYYTGKALTSANTVQLQVNVTTAGSYSISTNTTDGFQFAVSGNFVSTGIQTVTLTASGTPSGTGVFVFSAKAGTGCDFTVLVNTEPAIMASLTTDCQRIQVNGRPNAGTKLTSAENIAIDVTVTAIGAYNISTDTLDGIYFAASGTFGTTGNKSVTLNGFGTPTLARNLIFTLRGAGTNCSINIAVTDPDPLAVYVLESGFGNPNPCIYTVSGAYTANTVLNSTNTVRINVFVTAVGNFTISTATFNGIIFSYSGTYTTTGPQTVLLQGTGTPAVTGTYSFAPQIVGPHPLGGQTCAFNIDVK